MRVFLTGGTGFIGQPLTRALLKRGWEVTLLARSGQSSIEGVRTVKGDVTDRETMRAGMADADIVFHNAGWYELGIASSAKAKMQAINVTGTENVLGLAAELKIPRIVYTSSTTAIGDTGGQTVDESFTRVSRPLTFYEQSKTEAHAIALKHQKQGAPIIIVCPAQVLGPGDHSAFGYFARLYVRNLLPPLIWAPDGAFTFSYVDDVAEGLALAAEKGRVGETYFFGGGSITIRELMKVWKKAVGGIPPFIWLPRPLAVIQGMMAEPLLRLFGISAFISREVIEGSYVSFRYSSEKAKRELGWNPRSAEQAWIDTLLAEKAKK
ncbi:MAG: NAD-dependent epimerase/dehydratase family protein [Chloroflexi bacterium]|nr:NAD-dependent epimerase/dehydratase family protein [Chloroflexota bacterium]